MLTYTTILWQLLKFTGVSQQYPKEVARTTLLQAACPSWSPNNNWC